MATLPTPNSHGLFAPRWSEIEDPDGAAKAMTDVAISLEVWSYQRRYANLAYARMFSGRDLPTVYGLSMSKSAAGSGGVALEYLNFRTPTFNLIGSSIETLVNKLGRNRVWVQYLTDGGDWKTRSACKKATDYVEGLFYGAKVHREAKQALQDGLVWGNGFIKVYRDGKQISVERVLPDELLVDDMESLYGRPRSLYQRKFVSKIALAAKYLERGAPDDQGRERRAVIERAIYSAASASPGLTNVASVNYGDMVPYLEGWSLGPVVDGEQKDGRHITSVGGVALNPENEQAWKRAGFPFAKFAYQNLGFGYWNQGLAEILAPHQKKINRLNEVIDEAQIRVGVPRVFSDTSNGVTAAMMANRSSSFIKIVPGQRYPEVVTPPAIQAELYQDLANEIAKGYKRAGISEDAAAGEAPDKVRSGAAENIREDIKSQRFICTGQAYEDFYVDISDLMMQEAIELKPQVEVRGRDVIKWQDVKDALKFSKAKAFPISSFSSSPTNRLLQADRMLAAGQISREDYLRVIDYPDVKGISSNLSVAAANNIERTLAKMMDDGVYKAPDMYMDVNLALSVSHAWFEFERSMGTPDDELEPIRTFIDQCVVLTQSPAAPAAPAPTQSIVASGPQGMQAQSTVNNGAPAMPAPTGAAGAAMASTQPQQAGGLPS